MGWIFRRSVNFGPLRVNLSKSGIGYSVGGPGFRMGVRSTGRNYTRLSLPGTGIGYQSTGRGQAGCLVLFTAGLAGSGIILRLIAR